MAVLSVRAKAKKNVSETINISGASARRVLKTTIEAMSLDIKLYARGERNK